MQESTPPTGAPRGTWRPAAALQAILALVALLLAGLGAGLHSGATVLSLEVELTTSTPGPAQVFAMVDGGYREEASQSFTLSSDDTRRTYALALPGRGLPARIRIDPGTGPGRIVVHRISLANRTASRTLEGVALLEAVTPRNQLDLVEDASGDLAMISTGNDPFFDFAPPWLPPEGGMTRAVAAIVLLLAATCLLGWLAWLQAPHAARWGKTLAGRHPAAFALLAAGALLAVLAALGTGCGAIACSPRGLGYGAALFLGVVGFAIIGAAGFRLLGLGTTALPAPGLFASALAGQVLLVAYVYVRSLIHAALGVMPLTPVELVLVAVTAAAYLAWARRRPAAGPPVAAPGSAWMLVRLALLAAVCLVVADRELPRLVMLSSDPDTHAFLAKQLQRMGGIYHSQGDWGPDPLRYPAGTAAMVFAWSSLSWLGVGNALAAIPLMVTLLASLAVAESMAPRATGVPTRTLAMLTAAGVTAAALLFPVYTRFAHMEGAGRQMSIGAVALLAVCAWATGTTGAAHRRAAEWRFAAVATPTLFLLAVLNPVNVLLPSLFVGIWALVVLVTERRLTWWLVAPLACPLLLAMDPYYFGLMTGRVAPESVHLAGDYTRMTLAGIASAWLSGLSVSPMQWLQPMLELLPGQGAPTFAVLLAALAVAAVAAGLWPRRPAALAVSVVLAVGGIYLVNGLLQTLVRDARFYLLPAYFPVSLAQYKAVLLVVLAAWIPAAIRLAGRPPGHALAASALLVVLFALTVRPVQPMHLAPRHDYCGSMGCLRPSDLEVIGKLQELLDAGAVPRVDGRLPRILVPNALVDAGDERWIFPTGASRYLALTDTLPLAFYYYQGDSDYTTANYRRHVCDRLDRAWLAAERIGYVFLPADRDGTCLAGLDTLAQTDTVVAASGRSMLVRLEAPRPSPTLNAPEAEQGQE